MASTRSSVRPGAVRNAVILAVCAGLVPACADGDVSEASPLASTTSAAPTSIVPATTVPTTTVPARTDPTTTTPANSTRPVPTASASAIRRRGDPSGHVLLVGDSVAALVADDLARRLRPELHVDGVDCRRLGQPVAGPCGQVDAGVEVDDGVTAVTDAVDALAAEGIIPDSAVFVLADNSSITRSELDAAMRSAAGIDHVWWVNTRIEGYGRQDENNRLLDELAADDPRAGVVDWFTASAGEDWLADHVHPNDAGQAALADLIVDRLLCACTA